MGGGAGPPAEDPLASSLKEVFTRWAAGVCIVAVRTERGVQALTVSAFMPLSLDPPLVAVSLGANAAVLPFLNAGTEVAISILAAGQRAVASRFADSYPVGPSPFPEAGPPVVEGALAALRCRLEDLEERGDHHLAICEVLEARGPTEDEALVYFGRDYHGLGQGNA